VRHSGQSGDCGSQRSNHGSVSRHSVPPTRRDGPGLRGRGRLWRTTGLAAQPVSAHARRLIRTIRQASALLTPCA
jgi:hypothetical protein